VRTWSLLVISDQANLGMGYLAAMLRERGRTVELIEVRDRPVEIAARLNDRQPLVVGFSLIFQAFLPQFRQLASHLRAAGIKSHFTIGGHFASLCQDEVLAHFPELDSVVRYEGEETLCELVERLSTGTDWRDIRGIAYLEADRVVVAEDRALIPDLDSLPFPYRPNKPETIGGFLTLPLLASRGVPV
jgi:anaerobic magnesium-protoporphyrin IX monomethyl ester cyclase